MIETDRMILRPWRPDDGDAFVAVFTEPEIMWFPKRRPLTAEEAREMHARLMAEHDRQGFGMWAAELKTGGGPIGFIGLTEPTWIPALMPSVEVGWRLAKAHWGQGLASEGGAACLRFAFEVLGLERVISLFEPENVASGRVMEKIGMHHAGDTEHPTLPLPVRIFEITRDGWRAFVAQDPSTRSV